MKEQAKRITIRRGRVTQKFVIESGPCPDVGDEVRYAGEFWMVTKVEDTEVILRIPMPPKGAESRNA